MKTRIYYNTTDAPVVIDGDGHILGGGEWLAAERNDEIRRALDQGRLIESEPDENASEGTGPASKAHKAAFEANAEDDANSAEAADGDTEGSKQVESPTAEENTSKSRKSGKKQER